MILWHEYTEKTCISQDTVIRIYTGIRGKITEHCYDKLHCNWMINYTVILGGKLHCNSSSIWKYYTVKKILVNYKHGQYLF